MFVLKRWALNLWILADEGLNTLTGGAPDETVSSRLGRAKDQERNTFGRKFARVMCWMLDKIDKGHCDKTEAAEKSYYHRPESAGDKPGD